MIALRLAAKGHLEAESVVARLVCTKRADQQASLERDYRLCFEENGWAHFAKDSHTIVIKSKSDSLDGDVVMLPAGGTTAHRLIRANSKHNSLLVTEQCDQLCVMCSQPPKAKHNDMFSAFVLACMLAPRHSVIGITGGEPLLYKHQIFALVMQVHQERPDISFHILTNGQHFCSHDVDVLSSSAFDNVLWAIPVYSHEACLHNKIVGKPGAFENLLITFDILSRTAAQIELRTVLMQSNQQQMPELANFLTQHIPFASQWSIMQMERIGYGRMNWSQEFYDSSEDFGSVGRALSIGNGRGLDTRLFNFPLCTIPFKYQRYAVSSISDWKRKFENFCDGCNLQSSCGGFFEWYSHDSGFKKVGHHEEA